MSNYLFINYQGFRPLSGKWGYRSGKRYIMEKLATVVTVSVPSRGNGVIDASFYERKVECYS